MSVGDEIYLLDGTVAYVTGSELEKLDEPITFYNLEVADFNTYFVGDVPVLVHNYENNSDFRQTGKDGESASGITKNTQHIESLTGTAKYRIPDGLDEMGKVLTEVKNVKNQALTRQLNDFLKYSEKYDYTFELFIRKTTKLTSKLQEKVDEGKIIINYLPW